PTPGPMLNPQLIRASKNGASGEPTAPRSAMNEEVELKLLAPAGTLDRGREASGITRHAQNGGGTPRLETVYYDTPDHALFNHGLSLRIRRRGKGYLQTLKKVAVDGQPFTRGEWETPVGGPAPELEALPVSELGAPLDQLSAGDLSAIFAT